MPKDKMAKRQNAQRQKDKMPRDKNAYVQNA